MRLCRSLRTLRAKFIKNDAKRQAEIGIGLPFGWAGAKVIQNRSKYQVSKGKMSPQRMGDTHTGRLPKPRFTFLFIIFQGGFTKVFVQFGLHVYHLVSYDIYELGGCVFSGLLAVYGLAVLYDDSSAYFGKEITLGPGFESAVYENGHGPGSRFHAEHGRAWKEFADSPVGCSCALREDHQGLISLEVPHGCFDRTNIRLASFDGKGINRYKQLGKIFVTEKGIPGHEMSGSLQGATNHYRVVKTLMI